MSIDSKKKVQKEREQIEKEFVNIDSVIMQVPLTEAIVRNQKLILETLLDIRDDLSSSNR